MIAKNSIDLDELASSVIAALPSLDVLEQRISLELYRLLMLGRPVQRAVLAQRSSVPAETVDRVLDGWKGVFYDRQRRVVGYWGLSLPRAYAGAHRLTVNGRKLSAWCAWDTLFLPQLLGVPAEIESVSPSSTAKVRLTVTPERVTRVAPAGAHMSFVRLDADAVMDDVINTFCHFVNFFPAREAGERWTARHPDTFLLSIDEAHILARRKNDAQYAQVLASG